MSREKYDSLGGRVLWETTILFSRCSSVSVNVFEFAKNGTLLIHFTEFCIHESLIDLTSDTHYIDLYSHIQKECSIMGLSKNLLSNWIRGTWLTLTNYTNIEIQQMSTWMQTQGTVTRYSSQLVTKLNKWVASLIDLVNLWSLWQLIAGIMIRCDYLAR